MTDKELKDNMTFLLNSKETKQSIIAKAVQLGIDYQTSKIKSGISIVFDSLSKKN